VSAAAYVNHGRWVAGCPREFCNSAQRLEPGQARIYCGGEGGCGLDSEVIWPDDAQAIWDALRRRPVPGTRNWFPTDHELALRANCPHGQSVADLLAENEIYGVR
jgi:hypothetical protein